MKKLLLLLTIAALSFALITPANSQTVGTPLPTKMVAKYYAKQKLQHTEDKTYKLAPVGTVKNIWVATSSVSFSLTNLTISKAGGWKLGGAALPGYNYLFLYGRGTKTSTGATFQPYIGFGAAFSSGVVQNPDGTGVVGSAIASGVVTVWKWFTVQAGYNFVQSKPAIGVGLNLNLTDLNVNTGGILSKNF